MNDKYVEERARELIDLLDVPKGILRRENDAKDFIRTIVEECKPKANVAEIDDIALAVWATSDNIEAIEKLEEWLESKGMQVE